MAIQFHRLQLLFNSCTFAGTAQAIAYVTVSFYDGCSPLPCQSGYSCASLVQSSYSCACSNGMNPPCIGDVDYCASAGNPCLYGSTCVNTQATASFTCDCPAGLTGDFCDVGVDFCATNPCGTPYGSLGFVEHKNNYIMDVDGDLMQVFARALPRSRVLVLRSTLMPAHASQVLRSKEVASCVSCSSICSGHFGSKCQYVDNSDNMCLSNPCGSFGQFPACLKFLLFH